MHRWRTVLLLATCGSCVVFAGGDEMHEFSLARVAVSAPSRRAVCFASPLCEYDYPPCECDDDIQVFVLEDIPRPLSFRERVCRRVRSFCGAFARLLRDGSTDSMYDEPSSPRYDGMYLPFD